MVLHDDDDDQVAGAEKGTTTLPAPKKRKVKVIIVKKKKKRCIHCGNSPCEWTVFGPRILSRASRINNGSSFGVAKHDNDEQRDHLYRYFIRMKYGKLGQYNRRLIPWCVEGRIKDMFPSVDGNYTWFRPCWL